MAGAREENHTALSGVPKGKGLLYLIDGETRIVDGPFDGDKLRDLLKCRFFQMVPATVGALAGKVLLLMDEEGAADGKAPNPRAEEAFGDQVYGGRFQGHLLVLHPEDLE